VNTSVLYTKRFHIMPTRKTKRADNSRPPRRHRPDPVHTALLAAKALALAGDLPGCRCYVEAQEPGRNDLPDCPHVKDYALGTAVQPAKPKAKVRDPLPPAAASSFIQQVKSQAHHFRQLMESDDELTDEEIEQIDEALEQLEPTRKAPSLSTEALTKEALIAVYGKRYDDGQSLYCPRDAVQRRRSKSANPDGENGNDLRFATMEAKVQGKDGKTHIEERTVVQRAAGQIEVLGRNRKVADEGGAL